MMPRTETAQFYMLYFQEPGEPRPSSSATRAPPSRVAVRRVGRRAAPGGGSPDTAVGMVPRDGGFLSRRPVPERLPTWLTEADIDFYAAEFTRTGFRGGLNWYRNIDRDFALMAPFDGLEVAVPALYIAGDRDSVVTVRGRRDPPHADLVPDLRGTIMIPGCGHWTQQERPDEVNAALIGFLKGLP